MLNIMGGCLSCLYPRDPSLLAEYNPLILGSSMDNTENSMYTERLIEYTEENVQKNIVSCEKVFSDPLNDVENKVIEQINHKMMDT